MIRVMMDGSTQHDGERRFGRKGKGGGEEAKLFGHRSADVTVADNIARLLRPNWMMLERTDRREDMDVEHHHQTNTA